MNEGEKERLVMVVVKVVVVIVEQGIETQANMQIGIHQYGVKDKG